MGAHTFSRVYAAILENNQTKNSIKLPEVLHKYTGFESLYGLDLLRYCFCYHQYYLYPKILITRQHISIMRMVNMKSSFSL